MFPAKTSLPPAEMDILRMVHNLYGRRHHRDRECFLNEDRDNLIFIRNRSGDAQFAVNLTQLARIRTTSTVQFQEKYLLPDLAGKPHLPSGEEASADGCAAIVEQHQHHRMAS